LSDAISPHRLNGQSAPSKAPQVTVVVPCYNAEPWLRDALHSVRSQRGVRVETIVVNDGSTDGSAGILDELATSIRRIDIENSGPSAARNLGLQAATADKVLFVDADDYIEGAYLSALVKASESSGAQLTFGVHHVEKGSGERTGPYPMPMEHDAVALLKCLLAGDFPQTGCVLWDTHFLRSIGGWREDLRIGEDIELLIRALVQRPTVAHSAAGHLVHRNHGGPDRLTHNVTASDREKQYAFSGDLLSHLGRLEDPEVLRLFGLQQYWLAKVSYAAGYEDLARRALQRARALGFYGHAGNRIDVLVGRLLGLQRQVRYLHRARAIKRSIVDGAQGVRRLWARRRSP
jgi:glycosyltransferase involved in cell wall biosynthesis